MNSEVVMSVVSRVFCFAACLLLAPRGFADRPNIIFLMADDQSTWSMGCYGTPGARTPNLDQLAAEGVVFDAHYDTTAICMASRATVMAGLLEYRHGCNFEHGDLVQSLWQQSYPMRLRQEGYRTAFAGKFGFEVTEAPNRMARLPAEDFDRWGGGPGQTSYVTAKNKSMREYAEDYPHSTRSYGAFGRDFVLESANTPQPFCLSISFKAPHHPVQPDPLYDDLFADQKFSRPGNFGRENGTHFSLQSRQGRQYERFHSWKYSSDYDGVMAKYFQQIYAIDVAVGMIRDAVIKAGVADDTVIIYTSDNGFMNGSHGYGSKVLPYEEATRVPLIIFDPRHDNSGRQLRCDSLTGNIDLAPTILDLAGIDVPADLDGKSLLPLYDDPQTEVHSSLPLLNVWGPAAVHSLAVVTKDAKYVYWPWAAGDFQATEELYDLSTDRLELINLAAEGESSAQLQQQRTVYDQWVKHWKQKAVAWNRYQPFATIFDRNVEWKLKQQIYAEMSKRKK
jgi:arylsulfatase A-like enzyme